MVFTDDDTSCIISSYGASVLYCGTAPLRYCWRIARS